MPGQGVWEGNLRDGEPVSELAACVWKLDAVYARLQGARNCIVRLEEDNAGLRDQNRSLQDLLVTGRPLEGRHTARHLVWA